VLGAATGARADSPKLAQAIHAIDQVQYYDAQRLLVAAIEDGGNSPQALAEIYVLSARTAIALSHPELAEQYYRRWLALVPGATLSEDVAPKLRERFVAAQAYMAAHGRLAVVVRHTAAGIDVIVQTDPLAMAASADLDHAGHPTPLALEHPAHFASEPAPRTVIVLDDHGNQLLALDVPAEVVQVTQPQPPLPPRVVEPRSLLREPLAWAAPTVAFVGVSVWAGIGAHNANDELSTIVSSSGRYYYQEAKDVRERRDRDAVITDVALGLAGACAVTAIVLLILDHHGDGHAAATLGPAPGGIAVAW
jgi:hypothetical protein